MGDFWSGTTAYDERTPERNRRKAAESAAAAAQEQQRIQGRLDQYGTTPASQTELGIGGNSNGQIESAINGLNLGKILTGQDIYTTGSQVQDAIKRSEGLVSGNNPVTSEMTGQRNAAVARTTNQMAKAGVKGGASVAAAQQVGSAMDKQIASQAHQMYTNNLQNHLKTLSGVSQAQVTPMYTNQDMYLSATAPGYERQAGNGLLSGFMDSLFG